MEADAAGAMDWMRPSETTTAWSSRAAEPVLDDPDVVEDEDGCVDRDEVVERAGVGLGGGGRSGEKRHRQGAGRGEERQREAGARLEPPEGQGYGARSGERKNTLQRAVKQPTASYRITSIGTLSFARAQIPVRRHAVAPPAMREARHARIASESDGGDRNAAAWLASALIEMGLFHAL